MRKTSKAKLPVSTWIAVAMTPPLKKKGVPRMLASAPPERMSSYSFLMNSDTTFTEDEFRTIEVAQTPVDSENAMYQSEASITKMRLLHSSSIYTLAEPEEKPPIGDVKLVRNDSLFSFHESDSEDEAGNETELDFEIECPVYHHDEAAPSLEDTKGEIRRAVREKVLSSIDKRPKKQFTPKQYGRHSQTPPATQVNPLRRLQLPPRRSTKRTFVEERFRTYIMHHKKEE